MKASAYTRDDWMALEDALRTALRPTRFQHTLGVTYTACALAMRYGEDISKARLAGLLHDCAKHLPADEMIAMCRVSAWPVSETAEENHKLLHAGAGPVLAARTYGVEEEDILLAIAWHTTGRPDMTLLEEIVFVADYIEPNRNEAPRLNEIRNVVFTDLHAATRMILEDTLEHLKSLDVIIDPATAESYAWYKEENA